MKNVQKFLFAAMFLAAVSCSGSNDPKVSSINPDEGSQLGGTNVTIKGDNFVEILEVLIGGVNCESINIVSEKELTCETGANPAVITDAVVDIEIRNINGDNGKLRDAFTYRAE
ncbi:MAG: IPT/TIG domain-containing protein [Bdellovibrionota bacterium]